MTKLSGCIDKFYFDIIVFQAASLPPGAKFVEIKDYHICIIFFKICFKDIFFNMI